MKTGDRVQIKGSGYLHKGMKGTIKKKNERFCYISLDGISNLWSYHEKDLMEV